MQKAGGGSVGACGTNTDGELQLGADVETVQAALVVYTRLQSPKWEEGTTTTT